MELDEEITVKGGVVYTTLWPTRVDPSMNCLIVPRLNDPKEWGRNQQIIKSEVTIMISTFMFPGVTLGFIHHLVNKKNTL